MYRIYSTGTAIECDTPQDVAALLAVFAPPAPQVEARSPKPKTQRKAPTRRTVVKPRGGVSVAASESTEAASRRELLRGAIAKAEVGLTTGELRARGPKMSDVERRNALQTLKVKGEIKRAGNAWVAA